MICLASFPDGCDPVVYRVLDDHRRSVNYRIDDGYSSHPAGNRGGGEDGDYLCDDVLPFGWYRFLAYGM